MIVKSLERVKPGNTVINMKQKKILIIFSAILSSPNYKYFPEAEIVVNKYMNHNAAQFVKALASLCRHKHPYEPQPEVSDY